MVSKMFGAFDNAGTYSSKSGRTSTQPITEAELVQIARIVRAWAEVEDCLTLFICVLAKFTESQGLAVLPKTSWSRKVEMAKKLAELRDDGALGVFDSVFTTGLSKIAKARNAVAHGVYIGRRDDGALCFLTTDEAGPNEGPSRPMAVFNYNHSGLQEMADALEQSLPDMVEILQIGEHRKARYTQPLRAHPKAQPRKPRDQG